MTCALRERERSLTRWINLTKQDIGNRSTGLFACIPLSQHCRNILLNVRHGKRLTGYQNHYYRLARSLHRLNQFILRTGKRDIT